MNPVIEIAVLKRDICGKIETDTPEIQARTHGDMIEGIQNKKLVFGIVMFVTGRKQNPVSPETVVRRRLRYKNGLGTKFMNFFVQMDNP